MSDNKREYRIEHLIMAIGFAVNSALQEVRRQGGPDYLLKEARNAGVWAGITALGLQYTELVSDPERLEQFLGKLE